VGGDPFKNKSVFHVTATPWSLPSFVTDVGATLMETIRAGAAAYPESGGHPEAAVIENRAGDQGSRNEFWADVTPYSSGSDHDDYDSSTIAVPSLYLRDWPDIYIHTDHDSLAQIDATKLRRVALLGAAAGYVYAAIDQANDMLPFLLTASQKRLADVSLRSRQLLEAAPNKSESWYEARNLIKQSLNREIGALHSLASFAATGFSTQAEEKLLSDQAAAIAVSIDKLAREKGASGQWPKAPWAADAAAQRIPVRIGDFGPLTYQNDNVLLARLGQQRYSKIKLLTAGATSLISVQDQGELYAYEIVNFVNGRRSVGEIRDNVSAEYGPISADLVDDYLQACVEAGGMRWK
jgi:aminopeptidase YwaD